MKKEKEKTLIHVREIKETWRIYRSAAMREERGKRKVGLNIRIRGKDERSIISTAHANQLLWRSLCKMWSTAAVRAAYFATLHVSHFTTPSDDVRKNR